MGQQSVYAAEWALHCRPLLHHDNPNTPTRQGQRRYITYIITIQQLYYECSIRMTAARFWTWVASERNR